jgi:hypothetical protein
MHVASDGNVSHVATICQRFLQEKYHAEASIPALSDLVREAIVELNMNNQNISSIEDANKRIILNIKSKVLAQPEPLPRTFSDVHPTDDADEDEFFKKLQDLETQRCLPPPVNAAPPIISSNTANANPNANTATTQQSIVYLPSALPRVSKPVVINGADRMWEYFTKRSTLVWTGPIPANVAQAKLTALLLPSMCSRITPLVLIEITGAAGNTIQIVCTRSTCDLRGDGWETWTPCGSESLKVLACPWTLKLKDHAMQPLDMGEDAFTIIKTIKLYNGNTKITLSAPPSTHGISKNSMLLIKSSDVSINVNVLAFDVNINAMEIAFVGDIDLVGTTVCNLSHQATIVLALTSE